MFDEVQKALHREGHAQARCSTHSEQGGGHAQPAHVQRSLQWTEEKMACARSHPDQHRNGKYTLHARVLDSHAACKVFTLDAGQHTGLQPPQQKNAALNRSGELPET